MLLTISVLLVLLFTGHALVKVHQHKERLPGMTGIMVSMSISMIASLTSGSILGIIFKNNLTYSTISAILFSLVLGCMIGKPIGLLALAEGVMAGIMGGMMGAMLGVMLPPDQFKTMLIFMDCLYVLMMSLIISLIVSYRKKAGQLLSKPFLSHPIVTTAVVSMLMIFASAYVDENHVEANVHEHHHQ